MRVMSNPCLRPGIGGSAVARRRELVSVADGVASWFCSRNNDFQGAWLPGVMYAQVQPEASPIVVIDLMDATGSDLAGVLAARTRRRLVRHRQRIGLPRRAVQSAALRVEFEPRVANGDGITRHVPPSMRGADSWWFTVTVTIIDDLGRSRSASRREWCCADYRPLPIRWSAK